MKWDNRLKNKVQGYYDNSKTPLYRYWNSIISDHFYTTNPSEPVGLTGYNYEGVQSYIYQYEIPGSVALYCYWQPDNGDHFYTTQWKELGTNRERDVDLHGYVNEGIAGYCMPQWKSQTVALTHFFNAAITDHSYTTNRLEATANGYNFKGIERYVPPY